MNRIDELISELMQQEEEYNKFPTPELKEQMCKTAKELNTLLLNQIDDDWWGFDIAECSRR